MRDMEGLRSRITGDIGKNIVLLEKVDSTNTFALNLPDAAHGTAVVAEEQTVGRGRQGRRWVSPPGRNICLSVILRPQLRPEEATLLTLLAGVACCEAVRGVTGLPVGIKWPNDLMLRGRKMGGILTELKTGSGSIQVAVIGIGINVNAREKDFPPELCDIATSVLIETGMEHDLERLAAEILNRIDAWYSTLLLDGRQPLINAWRGLSVTLGQRVRVVTGNESLVGTAEEIDELGRLILRLESGGTRAVHAGDLALLRPGL